MVAITENFGIQRNKEKPTTDEVGLSELLCGNGNNKHAIIVKCKYEVYIDEWDEIEALINNTLQNAHDGKYSNVIAELNRVSA